MKSGLQRYLEDRLVIRWVDPQTNRILSQGKRIPAEFCDESKYMTLEERRLYVLRGAVEAVRLIQSRTGNTLSRSLERLNDTRGAVTRYRKFGMKYER
jgi:hypothetical protein